MFVRVVITTGAALLAAASIARAQTGGPYSLIWSTIDGGGEMFSAGGSYTLGGTIGQADAGDLPGRATAAPAGSGRARHRRPATPTATTRPPRRS